jgi:hypothetical protein
MVYRYVHFTMLALKELETVPPEPHKFFYQESQLVTFKIDAAPQTLKFDVSYVINIQHSTINGFVKGILLIFLLFGRF